MTALPPSLIGSALESSRSILELAGIDSVRHRGSFQQLLTKATPVAPLLLKSCHVNPIQCHSYILELMMYLFQMKRK